MVNAAALFLHLHASRWLHEEASTLGTQEQPAFLVFSFVHKATTLHVILDADAEVLHPATPAVRVLEAAASDCAATSIAQRQVIDVVAFRLRRHNV